MSLPVVSPPDVTGRGGYHHQMSLAGVGWVLQVAGILEGMGWISQRDGGGYAGGHPTYAMMHVIYLNSSPPTLEQNGRHL